MDHTVLPANYSMPAWVSTNSVQQMHKPTFSASSWARRSSRSVTQSFSDFSTLVKVVSSSALSDTRRTRSCSNPSICHMPNKCIQNSQKNWTTNKLTHKQFYIKTMMHRHTKKLTFCKHVRQQCPLYWLCEQRWHLEHDTCWPDHSSVNYQHL